jgi:divalent metal cation (Fe/Co/Zn/Cd) transporter
VNPEHRHALVAAAIRWCAASVAWAALAGVACLAAGVAASSNALVAFGANSMLDGTASGVLVWRFRHERSRADADVDAVERRGAFAVGAVMTAVAVYVGARAVRALADHSVTKTPSVGLGLTTASVLVLPVLAQRKLRLSAGLRSPGLRGDGVLSFAGAVLAGATLLSLVLDAALGWWCADAVAALLISAMLLMEGVRTIASARTLSLGSS